MCKLYLAVAEDNISEELKFSILTRVLLMDSTDTQLKMWTPWFTGNRLSLLVECQPDPPCFLLEWRNGTTPLRLRDSFIFEKNNVKIYVGNPK